MARPDWNAKQKPDQRSIHHALRDARHNEKEHGLGGRRDPEREKGPKQRDDDLRILEPDDEEPLASSSDEPLVGAYPLYYYVPRTPPVTDQGSTPMCVAYSNAYDQNQHDRPELGRFFNLDEPKFFRQIGGTSAGAYMTAGLIRRRDYGYPEQDSTPQRGRHRIASYTQIPLTVNAIKDALSRGHGVLMIGDWFHSWFHPLASGKLPAPDYKVGGHGIWVRGWNDNTGWRFRNTWGRDWGLDGDGKMPYAFLSRMYAAYRTTDR